MTEEVQLPPGFRFHPTDEELILHYLRNQVTSLPCPASIIAEVDIYKFDPWDLPGMAMFGDKEWYFFSPRDRKYPNGMRPNRAAGSGYWKATGTDKIIESSGLRKESIGVKKSLVFYKGRPPRGIKTSWIMNEYRLVGSQTATHITRQSKSLDSMRLDDWVLCRIYRRLNGVDGSETNKEADVKLPGAFSSELLHETDLSVLSLMFYGNPLEISSQELTYQMGYDTINGHEGEDLNLMGNDRKRQRTSPDHHRKIYHSFNQTADSLITQPFPPQNLLLTSNLGFQ